MPLRQITLIGEVGHEKVVRSIAACLAGGRVFDHGQHAEGEEHPLLPYRQEEGTSKEKWMFPDDPDLFIVFEDGGTKAGFRSELDWIRIETAVKMHNANVAKDTAATSV